ncbi:MAG: hypothetical protein IPM56_10710 [Ignavibacteriales bacterium]|nr:MAG: hypothetical protein IPM56_10710 [Ignavibacteriales bacterium]
MIWYKVILTNNELMQGFGRQLETDFTFLFNNMSQPEDMKLYRSWLVGDQHLFYYMQMPDGFTYNLGEVFNKYRTTITVEPQTEELVLVIGLEEVRAVG